MKMNRIIFTLFVCTWLPLALGAWDKDKPAATTSLRQSNPEMLENQSSLEVAMDNEHAFATGGTQTGDHTQGSARIFSQADEPTTQIDGGSFVSTDLGSRWIDTDDNALYTLTATVPTWTADSTGIISTLLGSPRVFTDTLGVTGDFAVNTTMFTVTAASGNTLVAGTFESTGIATLADESVTKTSAAPTTDAMIVNKKYVDDQITANTDPAYSAGESHTFNGGLIMKMGNVARTGTTTTLTFGDPFDNNLVSVTVTAVTNSTTLSDACGIDSQSVSAVVIRNADSSAQSYNWIAIGN